MNTKCLLLALTLALGFTQAAKAAGGPSGMMLQQWCTGTERSLDSMNCTYFLLGLINGLSVADGFANHARKAWCLPKDLTAGQTKLIVKKFLREHPEELHRGASAIVAQALYIPSACNKRSGGP